jgi:hypothetical protein
MSNEERTAIARVRMWLWKGWQRAYYGIGHSEAQLRERDAAAKWYGAGIRFVEERMRELETA